jgi:hypothetical protein
MAAASKSKKRENDLTDRLHGLGLRKQTARSIARSSLEVETQVSKQAREGLKELRSLLGEIDSLFGGEKPKRKAAAKKAAATRKRAATKRSVAAKKGARTRAKKKTRVESMVDAVKS